MVKHRCHFCLRKVVIGSTMASLQMPSCLVWFFLVLYLAHLSILVSMVCSFWVFFLTAQHSDPDIIAGLTVFFYIDFIFDLDRHLLIALTLLSILPRPPSTRSYRSLSLLLLLTYSLISGTQIPEHLFCCHRPDS